MIEPVEGIVFYAVFVLSATFHEAGHALVAKRGGDLTAYLGGQVSLDPRPHIRREPFGMVILPLITLVISGWPFGFASTPFDPQWERRYPKRSGLMALAGPSANLLLVAGAGLLIRFGMLFDFFEPPDTLGFSEIVVSNAESYGRATAFLLSTIFSLNIVLFALNLIPVPPLDGSSIILLFLSRGAAHRYLDFIRQSMFSLIGILIAWQIFDHVYNPIFLLFIKLLYPEVSYQ